MTWPTQTHNHPWPEPGCPECRPHHPRGTTTMNDRPEPPTARYRLEIEITGNTLDEIETELLVMTRGGFLLDSDHYRRDSWHVIGGRSTRDMYHENPDMTPERYDRELTAWSKANRAFRESQPEGADQ